MNVNLFRSCQTFFFFIINSKKKALNVLYIGQLLLYFWSCWITRFILLF